MRSVNRAYGAALWVLISLFASLSSAQVNVTTFHNDNLRTGQNLQETVLTPSNVNSSQFGKLFTTAVDGYVYAQPLYASGVTIDGASHDVVYVATEHDSVYALDAVSGAVYWHVNLLPAGGRTVVGDTDIGSGCDDIQPEIGITGTPVIDPASNTLYVVTAWYVAGAYHQHLHALDLSTAAEKFGGPVDIAGSVAGAAGDSKGGVLKFNAKQENQRTGLMLKNGRVYIAWGGHCDYAPFHGWVMAYDAATLTQQLIYSTTPNTTGGAIWIGGALASDSSANIFFASGNGPWDGTTEFGDSIVRATPAASGTGLDVLDYFTPWDETYLGENDNDLGSGGIVLLPTLPNGTQLAALMGKLGTIYVVNRNNLGKYCGSLTPACTNSNPQIFQEIPGATEGVWGSPAYWNGNLYWAGQNVQMAAFAFNTTTGAVSASPTSVTHKYFSFPAPTPSISANGNSAAILWGIDSGSYAQTCSDGVNCQILYAYDATNLSKLLYASNQAAGNRDVPGQGVKFQTPTIANGMVYVGSQYAVSGYGELSSTPTAATPVLNPAPGNYTAALSVTLTDATAGASIYYTTDGSTPTTGSTRYTGPIAVGATTTISAIAAAAGYANSAVASGVYTISLSTTATPTFTPAPGSYSAAQTVSLSDATPGAKIYYTTDGTTPTTSSALYSAPLSVSATTTINAIAAAAGYKNSAVASGVYTISLPQAATPTFSPAPGTYTAAQSVTLSDATPGAKIYYALNGALTTANAILYTGPLAVSATTTINAAATASGYTTSGVAGGTFTISASQAGTPVSVNLGSAANVVTSVSDGTTVPSGGIDYGGNAYSAQLLGTSLSWSDAVFNFGTPGVANGIRATTVTLPAGNYQTLSLLGTGVNGGQPNLELTVTYTDGTTTVLDQSFSDWLSPANFAGESIVSTMAYRDSGSGGQTNTPTYLYGYRFAIDAAKTVASLTLPATPNVAVLAIDLVPISQTKTPTTATPTFSPAPGTYASAQTVALADATAGAKIYYTTDGTTPSTSSTPYTAPVAVGATMTINAIAAASGYLDSAVASGSYTITATQTGSPVAVSLTAAADVVTAVTDGTTVPSGGIDYDGNAYSANLLGTSLTWSGAAFTFASPGMADGVRARTLTLPAGNYQTLTLLGTGVNGAQPGQTLTVTYTDGSKTVLAQSFSDWLSPQSYPGETIVSTMAHHDSGAGGQTNTPTYLYGYRFAINGAKTVASLTLPVTPNVVVLAIDLVPVSGTTTPTAATPTFSPAPGTYATAQSVTLADATSGASIYYTTDGTMPTPSSTVYTAPITVSATTTINAIAAAGGYLNSAVASGSYTITATQSGTPVSVSLAAVADVVATYTDGVAVVGTGIDYSGHAYSANLLGASLTWSGATFKFGPPAVTNAVRVATIPLPAGKYTGLSLLGTGVDGSQPGQVLTVTYTDGTTTVLTQGFSDWATPQNYPGETIVSTMAYRDTAGGLQQAIVTNLYGYTFALDSAKTVASLSLPNNPNLVVLALDLVPVSSTTTPTAATPTFSPAPGKYTSAQSVTLADATSGASVYYTTNGTTPTTSSLLYTAPIAISATTTIKAVAAAVGYYNSAVASGTYTISPLPTAATPVLNPAPGTYTTAQTVTLSDATAGSSIYYTTDGTEPTTSSALYTGPLAVDSTTIVRALAVASGYTNSAVASGVYTINIAVNTTPISVSLGTAANLYGLADLGASVTGGGVDGHGNAYAATLVGATVSSSGATFDLAAAGPGSMATSTTIPLPVGRYTAVSLLASGVNGHQLNQTFVVTYTDGSTASFTQSMSDWYTPADYSGETTAISTAYRIRINGVTEPGPFYLYSYSFALDGSKAAKSLTLPANAHVVVAAVDVTPAATTANLAVNVVIAGEADVFAIAQAGSAVTKGGIDYSGNAYAASLLGPSINWAGSTFLPQAAGATSGARTGTIPLPAGNFATLNLLATGAAGNHPNEDFVVDYTDGTSAKFTQSVSNWTAPQKYPGESTVLSLPFRIASDGAAKNTANYLYGYSLALDAAKTVRSLSLPSDGGVVLIAAGLVP